VTRKAVTLKDVETARRAHRRALRAGINERIARVADFLLARADPAPRADKPGRVASRARPKLRLYKEDGP
jgi:putative transposase